MCREMCDGAGAGICDHVAPSTCSSLSYCKFCAGHLSRNYIIIFIIINIVLYHYLV